MLGILSDPAEVVGFSLRSISLTLFGVKETELNRSAATRLVTSGQYQFRRFGSLFYILVFRACVLLQKQRLDIAVLPLPTVLLDSWIVTTLCS